MSPNTTDHLAQSRIARVAGGCYAVYILAMVLADLLGHIGRGDAQQIYQAITTDLWSFHAIIIPGIVVSFVAEVGLALWLLVMGARAAPLRSRASGAAA